MAGIRASVPLTEMAPGSRSGERDTRVSLVCFFCFCFSFCFCFCFCCFCFCFYCGGFFFGRSPWFCLFSCASTLLPRIFNCFFLKSPDAELVALHAER